MFCIHLHNYVYVCISVYIAPNKILKIKKKIIKVQYASAPYISDAVV